MKPKPKKRYTVICLTPGTYSKLKRIANRDGRMLTRVAEEAVLRYAEADAQRVANG